MKKNLYFLLVILILTGLHSCKDQDQVYQEFVKLGGYVYPEKTNNLTARAGYKRVKLAWDAPKDPSVKSAKIYWNNGTEVIDIDYSGHSDPTVERFIEELEERTYTFELVNFDSNGNQSMKTEITVMPYGENWLLTHAERTIYTAEVEGQDAQIVTGYGTDEMIETRFRYLNRDGETVVLDEVLDASTNRITLPNAKNGVRFEFSSSYAPMDGLDTIWNVWSRSIDPIAGLLDCRAWGIQVTTGQVWDNSFLPYKALDGIIDRDHRWCSAQGALATVFPKIMTIDSEKDSYFINKIAMYQDQATLNRRFAKSVEIYWGNEPFDPDAGGGYESSPGFAAAIAAGNLQKTTFYFSTGTFTRRWTEMQNFRHLAIVWKDSRSTSGWIDLWEIEFYGYDSAEED